LSTDWSPESYLKFADERSRPALDMLARVPVVSPRLVYDLGCGPGNSTSLLSKAYRGARIIGIDSSPAMLAKAREILPAVEFIEADITQWQSDPAADLLFSNATFQWLPGHAKILVRLLQSLKNGGVVAIQMPNNLDEPSHHLMRDVAGGWAGKLKSAVAARETLLTPYAYYNLLKPHCSRLEIWHTTYNHALQGVQGIMDFVSSTGLRPFLEPLDENERQAFLAAYRAKLSDFYPLTVDGKVLMRFPRLFLVAQV
jgi:trans-aconitate 2-methyltransferase